MAREPLLALLVDVGGTLVDDSGWTTNRERYESLMLARLREAYGTEHSWFTTLIRHHFPETEGPDWEQRTDEHVAAFLRERGRPASPEEVERVCRACAVPLEQIVDVADGAREALVEIQRLGVRMATCSNTWWRNDADSRDDWEDLGLGDRFDAHVTSRDTHFGKPHPAMFQRALAALKVRPAEAAMLGDRLDRDVAGAQRSGLRAIWFRPPAFVGLVDQAPDAEVISWAEVPPLIRLWRRA
jgi:HAD superfamily hydrolase (TIGR01509 family)